MFDNRLEATSDLDGAAWSRRIAEPIVLARLERLRAGCLRLGWDGGERIFGTHNDDLSAHVVVRSSEFWSRVLLGGSIGGAEAYMDGLWDSSDLTATLRMFARDAETLDHLEAGAARIGVSSARLFQMLRRNTVQGVRRNIAEHYDLGNDFFRRMLDPTMTYSSAIWPRPEASLEEASIHKIDLLCRRLRLGPEDHLLEIGTGWGHFSIHAAKTYGCRVTTTTISREQHAFAAERIRAEGLEDRIILLAEDYRKLQGSFSKIVSVEMIEAVGAEYLDTYFAALDRLLAPKGAVALQAITMTDQRYETAARNADFIKRYIFPGSSIPSATALLDSATRASRLVLEQYEDFGLHYAKTLAAWRDNLAPHRAAVERRYGERFWRMWTYYLAYCEAGFLERYTSVAHLMFRRR